MDSSVTRLAGPFAVSLALHLCLGWMFAPGFERYRPKPTKAVTLTVFLATKQRPEPLPVAAAASFPVPPMPAAAPDATASASTSPTPVTTDAIGKLTQKARFLVPPDLAALEEIPVAFSGSLNIRLHVSPLGTVDRVTLLKSDPVPKELLDGLTSRLQHSRLTPALAGSEPVASTLDLVIHYEPAPTPLQHER